MGVDQAYARARRENVEDVRTAGEGARNETLNRAAYATAQLAMAAGFDPAECRGELLAAAKAAGLDEREAVATIRSAWASGEGNPRAFDRADKPRPMLQGNPRRVATFSYCDAEGEERYRKVRIEPGSQGRAKEFAFEHFRDGEWCKGRGGEAIAYRLAELAAADPGEPLYLAEGEAKADRLAQWGLLATSLKDLPDSALPYVADRDCIILPDNDATGLKLARSTAKRIEARGGRPLILKPFEGVGQGGDILDWQGDSDALSGLVRAAYAGDRISLEDDAPVSLPVIDAAQLCSVPAPPRRFMTGAIEPMGSATYLTGAGATGKSLLAQQWLTVTAAGLPFFGEQVEQCRSLYITCEDDQDELHRRQESINAALGITPDTLSGNLWLLSLKGEIGNELCTFGDGVLRLSERWEQIVSTVRALGIRHLALDNTSHLFAGNENDRHQVAAFVGLLDRLAQQIDGAVLFIGHPNKAGDEFSGSTAWENQVRSRLFMSLERDANGAVINPDGRTLTNSKPNYSERGKAIRFVWHQWAFLSENDLASDARARLASVIQANRDDDTFLACLAERTRQRRAVSDKRSSAYAPTVFASMPEARSAGITKVRLEAAMDRLFRTGRIERGQLWKGDDRKLVHGLRLTAGDGAETLRADAGDSE